MSLGGMQGRAWWRVRGANEEPTRSRRRVDEASTRGRRGAGKKWAGAGEGEGEGEGVCEGKGPRSASTQPSMSPTDEASTMRRLQQSVVQPAARQPWTGNTARWPCRDGDRLDSPLDQLRAHVVLAAGRIDMAASPMGRAHGKVHGIWALAGWRRIGPASCYRVRVLNMTQRGQYRLLSTPSPPRTPAASRR